MIDRHKAEYEITKWRTVIDLAIQDYTLAMRMGGYSYADVANDIGEAMVHAMIDIDPKKVAELVDNHPDLNDNRKEP